jgi:hypothetical protein
MTQIWTAKNGQLVRLGLWVPGVIRPDQPGMSGVPSGTSLTSVGTNITITDSGPSTGPFSGTGTQADPFLLYRLDVAGKITVSTAKFVHILQCDIHPTLAAGANDGVVRSTSANVPNLPDQVTIEQCNIHQATCTWGNTGIFGHGWTSIRNHVYHVEDGLGSMTTTSGQTNAYCTSKGDFVEYLVYVEGQDEFGTNSNPGGVSSPSSHLVDGTHSDCWQIQGGSYHTAIGTYFRGQYDTTLTGSVLTWIRKTMNDSTATGNGHNYYGSLAANSALLFNQNESWAPVNNVNITRCWIDGGRYSSVNYSGTNYGTYGTFDNHVIQNNTFYTNTGWTSGYWTSSDQPQSNSPGYPISMPVSGLYEHITWGGNVWYDTGAAVPVRYGTTVVGNA